jgi:hypothetical protein
VRYAADAHSMVVTSDATAAYRMVNKNVAFVGRTLVFLKPDILVVVDRVRLSANPLPVQVRFQIDNSDGKGSVEAGAGSFTVHRPLVDARTLVLSDAPVTVHAGTLGVPVDKGIFPYAEAESAQALDHLVLTVCEAYPVPGSAPSIHASHDGNLWRITRERGGSAFSIAIDATTDTPKVTIG